MIDQELLKKLKIEEELEKFDKKLYTQYIKDSVRLQMSPIIEQIKIRVKHPTSESLDNILCTY